MTYLYEVTSGKLAGCTFEVEQSIKDPPFTEYKYEGRVRSVRRVITGGTGFILKGGNWARDGYSNGVQSLPTKEERANLGKPPK